MLPCAVLLLPAVALAEPGVMLLPAVGAPGQLVVSGRVLKDVPTKGSSTLSKNLRRLAESGWEGAKVSVRFGSVDAEVTSGHDGDFTATLTAGKPGFAVGEGKVEAHVERVTPASAEVEILPPDAPFFVVSDFDDTLAVTQVLHKHKLLESALLKDESTQPAVPGMAELYQCMRKVAKAPPAFALVSGSPVQYGPRIAAFLKKNGFPFLGLYLRELSPQTLENYKQPVIRELLKQLPNKVVFFGDSGEHDPEVYAQMRKEFGERVLRTYIRDAGHAEDKKRFDGDVFFQQASEAAKDAAAHGLADPACVEKAFGGN